MATYNDYQALSGYIYNYGKINSETGELFDMSTIKVSNDSSNLKNQTIWHQLQENGKAIEIFNPVTGYYGSVYENKAINEYILVNRGTDFTNWIEMTNINDFETDVAMVLDNLPAQYEDAKELMERAQHVAGEGAKIQITGHSLGGALSQMLAVGYDSEAITFNAYNTRGILNNLSHFTEEQKNEKLVRLDTINTQLEGMGILAGEANLNLRNQLWEEKNTINKQLVEDELYQAWKANGEEGVVNYRITGDVVSSYVKLPNVGEDIFITYESKGEAKYSGGLDIFGFKDDVLSYHFLNNFAIETIQNEAGNIFITGSNGKDEALLNLVNKDYFGDKTKFEIDDMGNNIVRINQEHEFFFGVVSQFSDWQTTGDDRSQLITEKYDQIYNKVNLATVGTAEEVATARQNTINFMLSQKYEDGSPMYAIKHDIVNPDKQTYLLFTAIPKSKKPQQYDPLALDLDNNGKVETVGLGAGVLFDHDADGVKTGTGWVAASDGLVVRDINKNGQIDNGREIFGDNTILSNGQKAKDAFEAIANLDVNKDGKVDAKDAAFSELKVWQDKNQNGISEASELKKLTELGITSISTQASITGVQNSANGNVEIGFSSFERADGSTGNSGAFNFVGDPINSEFTDTVDTSLVMDIPNSSGSGKVRDLREAAALSADLADAIRSYMSKDYPTEADIETVVKLWAQTGQMDTIAATLKTGSHPADGRGTNLTTEEINKLGVLEKFTGLYAAATNFIDPMDAQDGKVDGRYSGTYYGINLDANSINISYNSLKIDIEKDLALASGRTSVFNLVDYKLQNGKVTLDFTRVYQWASSSEDKNAAITQVVKLYDKYRLEQNALFSPELQVNMDKWIIDSLLENKIDPLKISGNDFLLGSYGNDNILNTSEEIKTNIVYGMSGNDTFTGNRGSTKYLYKKGDGADTIAYDYNGVDTIYFGNGITPNDLVFSSTERDLLIKVGTNSTDSILIKEMHGWGMIEFFEFADGSKFSAQDLILPRMSTSGNDFIVGFATDDVINAGLGDDVVYGNGGNNIIDGGDGNDKLYVGTSGTLIGGAGHDYLSREGGSIFDGKTTFIGGAGSDTIVSSGAEDVFIFNKGDGKDSISTYGVGDVLRFGKGITLNDLSFLSYGNDLIMNIGDGGVDGIMIKNVYAGMYTSSQNIVEYLEFYDGTRIKTSEAVAQRVGNEKNETIIGFDADEVFYARGGNDYIKGMNGNDFIDGGSGNDYLYGGNGNDTIIGGFGSDTIYGEDGNDVLSGNEENDILFGGNGDDIIYGGSGNDNIDGNEGRNYLFGEDGDDVIKTTTSSSQAVLMSTTFNGGRGNDYLQGSYAGDIYVFNRGDGQDTINDLGEHANLSGEQYDNKYGKLLDVIEFGEGIRKDELIFKRVNNDLLIQIGLVNNDSITIKDHFTNVNRQIELLVFADGSKLDATDLQQIALSYFGSDASDTISGWNGKDNIVAKGGDDKIYTNSGDDFIDAGSGNDYVEGGAGDDNILGMDGNDVIYAQDGNDFVDGGSGNDKIYGGSGNNILKGGSGDDYIEVSNTEIYDDNRDIAWSQLGYKDGQNTLEGGAGNDLIVGGWGGDTYIYNLGDGNDTIIEPVKYTSSATSQLAGWQSDKLVFGTGISQNNLSFARINDDLVININSADSGSIKVKSWYSDVGRQIEELHFADGSVLTSQSILNLNLLKQDVIESNVGKSLAEILAGWNGHDDLSVTSDGNVYKFGGDGDDSLSGGAGNDFLNGGEGNDVITDAGGNNVFSGGKGDDYLQGATKGNCADTYLFNKGDGHDVIVDVSQRVFNNNSYNSNVGENKLIFGSEIKKEDVYLVRNGNWNFTVKFIGNSNDRIELQETSGWGSGIPCVDKFVFSDGSVVNLDQIPLFVRLDEANLSYENEYLNNYTDQYTIGGVNANISIQENYLHQYVIGTDQANVISIRGNAMNMTVDSGAGNDTIWTNPDVNGGKVTVFAGSGNDEIISATGATFERIVKGGTGDDVITGKSYASDTYLFDIGDGDDTITEWGDSKRFLLDQKQLPQSLVDSPGDVIQFGAGITQDDLSFTRMDNDLVINVGVNGTDSITIKDHFVNSNGQIEVISFADGTKLTKDEYLKNLSVNLTGTDSADTLTFASGNDIITAYGGNDTITTFAGADTIDAGSGDDIINAGTGNDIVAGGSGNDTYIYKAGDGQDIIRDISGTDTLNLQSIQASVLKFTQDNNDLLINFTNTSSDSIRVSEWFSSADNRIEQLKLDNGSILDLNAAVEAQLITKYGTSANDTLELTGTKTQVIAGTGNDTIIDKTNNNTSYFFNKGDGADTVLENNSSSDQIIFGVGIAAGDLSFQQSANDLVIKISASGGDSITIKEYFSGDNHVVEKVVFADNSSLDLVPLIANQITYQQTASNSNDVITGWAYKNRIDAQDGNDTITTFAGADTIDAGSGDDIINAGIGNDTIAGGSGNDTYIYKAGDGQDTIRDISGTDTLNLQSIQAAALKFTQDNNDLLINFTNTSSDSIRVSEWFSSADNRIEQLKLDGGSILDLDAAVEAQLITKYGTSSNDTLELTATKTQVIAGTGNDTITDVTANNTSYIFTKGDGKDTIIESNSTADTIQLNNITAQEISYSKIDNDLIINLGADDSITIKDFTNRANRIENISFNNGMTMLLAEALASAKVFGNDKTVISNADDNLWLEQGAKINLREGNNQAYINSNGIATTVTSGAGNDNVEVYDNANVTLNLGNGNNSALVQDGNHAITTGTGSDNLTLGAGISSLNVGDGNDNVTITKTQANSSFTVSLGAGNDSLKVNGAGGIIKVSNLSGDDTFNLANINTQISASGGNNLINLNNSGLAGDVNSISLAAGDDQLTVNSSGQTTIRAGEGTNQINLEGGGTFSVFAGGGDDQVKIQDLANSSLNLGNGNNTILAQDGKHRIITGSGSDSITLGAGISTISSGDGDDNVTITTTQNTNKYTINLGAGNDSLNFNGNGGELAQISSSSGNDQININNIRSQITLSSGDNTVNLNNSQLSGENNVISTGAGNDTIAVNSNGINTINAGNGTNQITLSGNSSNTVTSGSGNDVVRSNAGSLTLNSGAGDDVLEITSNEAQDKLTLNLGDGNDTVKISASGAATTIANNYGDDSYDLTGTQVKLSDTLGNTTLILNNQQLTNEVNIITTGVGNDNINITSNGSNKINAGNGNNQITLSGNSKDTITSGSGDDVILAGAGDDIINAGSGNDTMVGGTGNDVLNGSTGNDSYIFNKGDGADIIQDAGGNDIMKLGEGIKKEDLWFKKDNKDLTINNLTNQDKMTVKNWYAGSANKIEQIELADGEHISNISIDLLVQAMATFDVKPMAESSLTSSQQNTIQNALANTWVDPTK